MNKQEIINKAKYVKENCPQNYFPTIRFCNEVIEFLEQFDEPKKCDVWQKPNGDNITKCGVNLSENWTFNYCPNCGAKITHDNPQLLDEAVRG